MRRRRLMVCSVLAFVCFGSWSCSNKPDAPTDTSEPSLGTAEEALSIDDAATTTPVIEVPLMPTPSPSSTSTPLPEKSPTSKPTEQSELQNIMSIIDEVKEPLSFEWSPDGNYIAVGMEKGLLLLNGFDLSIITRYVTSDRVDELAFSEEATYLAGSIGDGFVVWDGKTGDVLYTFDGEEADILQFLNDRDLLVGDFFLAHSSHIDTTTYRMGDGIVSSVPYYAYDAEPSGPFIFANGGKTLIYWGMFEIQLLERGKSEPTQSFPYGTVLESILTNRVVFSDFRRCALRISGLDDGQSMGEISWCDAEDGGQPARESSGPNLYATRFDVDLERDLAAIGHENGSVTLWQLSTGESLGGISVHPARISELKFNPSFSRLAILTRTHSGSEQQRNDNSFLTVWDFGSD